MSLQTSSRGGHIAFVAMFLLETFAVADVIAYKVERVCEEGQELNPKGDTWQQPGCATKPGTKQCGCEAATPKIGVPPKVHCRTVVRDVRPGENEAVAAAEKDKKPVEKKSNTPL